MMNGIKSMQEAVERIRDVQNVQIFQNELLLLKEYMKNIGMEKEDLLKLERTAYYILLCIFVHIKQYDIYLPVFTWFYICICRCFRNLITFF